MSQMRLIFGIAAISLFLASCTSCTKDELTVDYGGVFQKVILTNTSVSSVAINFYSTTLPCSIVIASGTSAEREYDRMGSGTGDFDVFLTDSVKVTVNGGDSFWLYNANFYPSKNVPDNLLDFSNYTVTTLENNVKRYEFVIDDKFCKR